MDILKNSTLDSEFIIEDIDNYDIYLIIRRKKITLHLDVKERTTVGELKKMIKDILGIQPSDQQLFLKFLNDYETDRNMKLSDPTACLFEYGLNLSTATVVQPAILGLTLRQENKTFENLEITPYSVPELPSDLIASLSTKNNKQKKVVASQSVSRKKSSKFFKGRCDEVALK